jgi:hypothetical protein
VDDPFIDLAQSLGLSPEQRLRIWRAIAWCAVFGAVVCVVFFKGVSNA